ncbi:MAG: DNA polymerase III subunit gamma/tau, partial [SAR324 cluster bacterium]|nr:DNA polymerase III subunit gamma/tau [SAR324 cluster bacterium]
MSYVVLARRLRPSRFDDLIGQETAAQTLRNAVLADRVAHAFLFSGSRGVGKTSAARILTRALNCQNPDSGDPCNSCENCVEINQNASPDVYEIDA